jgi:hypothetical protein
MTESRFRIGQLVRLKVVNTPGAPDLYQVVHVLEAPPNNEQYRLRGIHEPHERVVHGHQISLATSRAARSEAQLHPEEPQGTFRSITKALPRTAL